MNLYKTSFDVKWRVCCSIFVDRIKQWAMTPLITEMINGVLTEATLRMLGDDGVVIMASA